MGLLIMDCVIEAQSSRETIYGSMGKNEEEGKNKKLYIEAISSDLSKLCHISLTLLNYCLVKRTGNF